ncbi:hypothetical protein EBE87_15765 [Pseudoroseomonas wenyumeiae]|uniref:Uncharacterized protein n=1 Tax=Teichococcus wenyumeiae TaxID=2478470 RepID=A0A3A9JBZ9_9PROT|nr:hypothetical protein [Pseudoroseomonas wenyumeiae]RKK04012.1 hypothetical protein D6Z83_11715 [Pseudoroseomonas wenyumeiae]RMI19410.1 hypothetical protein EBE87_20665 [Pseudoroseomonas wenyumeiae]RMI20279.1 hypothetical protein EBE87_15765 [Pseudoroseomonas wenyumeiae]
MSTRTQLKAKAFTAPPPVATRAASPGSVLPAGSPDRLTNLEIVRAARPAGHDTPEIWNVVSEDRALLLISRDSADRLDGAASAIGYLQTFFGANDRSPALTFIAASLKDQARLLRAAAGAVWDRSKAQDAAYDAAAESDDADLLADHARFDALERRFLDLMGGESGPEGDKVRESQIKAVQRRQGSVLNRMSKKQAQSWAGIAARYRSLMLYDEELAPAKRASDPGEYESRRLLAMLLRDLGDLLAVQGLLDPRELP